MSTNHGCRKFTHTVMTNAKINIEINEILLGHSIVLWDAYYKPTPEQYLNEYLEVVEDLAINEENRLAKQVRELKTKNEDSEYISKAVGIDGKEPGKGWTD